MVSAVLIIGPAEWHGAAGLALAAPFTGAAGACIAAPAAPEAVNIRLVWVRKSRRRI